jgi:hypothetical protein
MAIAKIEKINGTCQLMNAVDNPIPFWATSHRDLGCPRATLPILDFRIPGNATCTPNNYLACSADKIYD